MNKNTHQNAEITSKDNVQPDQEFQETKIQEINEDRVPESDKRYILFTICLMVFLDFQAFGLPTTFYPQIAEQRGLNSTWCGVVLGLFSFGGFFTSCFVGKVMRFYQKKTILIFLLCVTCFSKFVFGFVYYIEDPTFFLLVSIFSRLILGFSFSAYQTVSISLIPETWPTEVVGKLAYYEISLNCGLITGPLLGALIYYFTNFFWIFAISAAFHLIVGLIGILKFMKISTIVQFNKDKKSLDMSKIIRDSTIMIQFFFQALFLGSIMWVSSYFENHIIDELGGTETTSALIYTLNMMGICISLLVVNSIYKKKKKKKGWFFAGSLMVIIFNNFIGPDPFFGITDTTTCLICISVSFFMVGVSQGMISVLMVPQYKDDLREIFTEEPEELLVDMAPAMYLASYSLAEFVNSIGGGIIIDLCGFNWASVIYSLILCVHFIIYWGNQYSIKGSYMKMVEEEENNEPANN